ncbi:hypothetical protein BC936DRAFT_139225 [Jimgerdemannia flammicorona]|uniref:Protein kinase domain-containing protein n=1 Tax=Jimgerdemannia flammicorona TaxID=994334 RepID=A0A433DMT8_9FUNG|nr:hypothetical protein BC936DRAFT_139225 [Jimgerdemannia flammicorona]
MKQRSNPSSRSSFKKVTLLTTVVGLGTLAIGTSASPRACVALVDNTVYAFGNPSSSWDLTALDHNSTAITATSMTVSSRPSGIDSGVCVQGRGGLKTLDLFVIGGSLSSQTPYTTTSPLATTSQNVNHVFINVEHSTGPAFTPFGSELGCMQEDCTPMAQKLQNAVADDSSVPSLSTSSPNFLNVYEFSTSKWNSYTANFNGNAPAFTNLSDHLVANVNVNSNSMLQRLFVIDTNNSQGFYKYEFTLSFPVTSITATLLNVNFNASITVMTTWLRRAAVVTVNSTVYVIGGADYGGVFSWQTPDNFKDLSENASVPPGGGLAVYVPTTNMINYFSFNDTGSLYIFDPVRAIVTMKPITGPSIPDFNASHPMTFLPSTGSALYLYNAAINQWFKFTSPELGWTVLTPSSSNSGPQATFAAGTTQSPSIEGQHSGVPIPAIAGGVAGGVIVIAAAIFFIVCAKRRKTTKKAQGVLTSNGYTSSGYSGVDDLEELKDHIEDTKDHLYSVSVAPASREAAALTHPASPPPFVRQRLTSNADSMFGTPHLSMAEILDQHSQASTMYDNWNEAEVKPSSAPGTVVLGQYSLSPEAAVQVNDKTFLRRANDIQTDEYVMIKFSADAAAFTKDIAVLSYLASPQVVLPQAMFELRAATMYQHMSVSEYSPSLDNVLPTIDRDDSFFLKLAIKSLADCLKLIHGKRIVHLEVTPRNLVHELGDVTSWRLVNFEAAGAVGDMIDWKGLSLTAYSAPELVRASGGGLEVTTSMDMWSLGCVLFEMSTRKQLFPGGVEEVRRKTQAEWSPPVEEVGNKGMEGLLKGLLVVDPNGRMNVEELVRAHERGSMLVTSDD